MEEIKMEETMVEETAAQECETKKLMESENEPKPSGSNKFTRFTAIFCVITVIITMLFYMGSKPFYMKDDLTSAKSEYAEIIDSIDAMAYELESVKDVYEKCRANDESVIKKCTKALEDAEDELREVCDGDSFWKSYWSDCYDNNYRCEKLHKAYEDAKDDYESKDISYKESRLNGYKSEMENLEKKIEKSEKKLVDLEKEIAEFQKIYGKAVFVCISFLSVCAAVVAIAVYLFMGSSNYRLGMISCSVGGVGSLLLLFGGRGDMFFTPHIWSIIIFAVFSYVIFRDFEYPYDGKYLVGCRVIAIVAAVLALLSSIGSLTALFVAPLYAAAMILVSFSLVPLDFKEYIKVSKHIFLSVITLGIWLLVWIYYVTRNLNKVDSMEKRNPAQEFLLCMFLPFYFPYWLYKNAEYIEAYGEERGKPVNKISILCFIIGFVCPIFSTILMQDKINQIVGKPE